MAGPPDRRATRLGVAAGIATGLAVTLVGLMLGRAGWLLGEVAAAWR